ncbi:MAG TPA: DegT/DnrJ/EryC1/StrS family aminotransferase [Candidatus Hydrogenedentes bacterium]|nr:DegT/DnrJ/EryC1/StrS family aminotransferase [Candidatus Hydrogenedentota bacterium]HPG69416.1 DegT/DnrJ/EryC1/StrS family aminotransferase [Candidatus Hydrogenedentota bacterium]
MGDQLAIHGGEPVAKEPFPSTNLGPSAIGDEEIQAVTDVLRSRNVFRFTNREQSRCAELERLFSRMTGCPYALAVGGGTGALIAGLVGIGVGEGDEVIVPGYTYIASASAALIVGALPVIAEIDETLTLDPNDIERNITSRTRAIMPVHMRGIPCDMDPILRIARAHGLKVIEDTSQACGGSYKGRRLGALGDAGTFSFQQSKVMTAGEGGMLVTHDRHVFERAAIRHDSAMCYWDPENTTVQPFPGENFRMNELEGALGCVQFARVETILARTRALQQRIREGIDGLPGITLHQPPDPEGDCGITLTMFFATSDKAREFAEIIRAEGIPAGSMYDQGIPDRHVYCYWEYVMQKLSGDRHGWPWTSPRHDQNRTYSADMCPRTLDILGRAVVLPISQTFEDRHAEMMVEGVRKVAMALAT